jgi:hypothetical protein
MGKGKMYEENGTKCDVDNLTSAAPVVDIMDDGFVSKTTKNQAKSVVNLCHHWCSLLSDY